VEPGALPSMYSIIACHVGGKLDSEALDLEEEIKNCKMGLLRHMLLVHRGMNVSFWFCLSTSVLRRDVVQNHDAGT
jgi:hypothetical protein